MNRFANIEFFRIFFSMVIVYFHILHSNIMPYTKGIKAYFELAYSSNNAGYIVECFFIISGYFLFSSMGKRNESFLDFLMKKSRASLAGFSFFNGFCIYIWQI